MSMIGNFLQLSSAQLESLIADPSNVDAVIYPEDEESNDGIDIDKAWHGIHFLLSGDAWGGEPPLANVVLGGTEVGDDVGYGPARYLTADEVRAAANALQDITPDVLRSRYVATALSENEIYPEIWDDPDDDAIEYLVTWYQILRDYYIDAAAKKNAMLKVLN